MVVLPGIITKNFQELKNMVVIDGCQCTDKQNWNIFNSTVQKTHVNIVSRHLPDHISIQDRRVILFSPPYSTWIKFLGTGNISGFKKFREDIEKEFRQRAMAHGGYEIISKAWTISRSQEDNANMIEMKNSVTEKTVRSLVNSYVPTGNDQYLTQIQLRMIWNPSTQSYHHWKALIRLMYYYVPEPLRVKVIPEPNMSAPVSAFYSNLFKQISMGHTTVTLPIDLIAFNKLIELGTIKIDGEPPRDISAYEHMLKVDGKSHHIFLKKNGPTKEPGKAMSRNGDAEVLFK